MKVKFEFDTQSENFDYHEYEVFNSAEEMVTALYEISNKLRGWEKYDDREAIPASEIKETIMKIINEHVNLEKLGY